MAYRLGGGRSIRLSYGGAGLRLSSLGLNPYDRLYAPPPLLPVSCGGLVLKRIPVGVAFVLLAVGGLVACSSADAVRTKVATCSTARPLTAGTTSQTITSGGRTRDYVLHVPPGYEPTSRTPLVVLFHGLGGDPKSVIRTTGMAAAADAQNAILVAPLGRGRVSRWNFRSPKSDTGSDVAFVRDLVKEVKGNACIDTSQVYAAGFSNGSALTLALACDGSMGFAAYAAVSGPYFSPGCENAQAASILYFHGMKDTTVPYEGAETVVGHLPPVNETMFNWATHGACPASGAKTTATPDVRHFSWRSCRSSTSVDIYVIVDGVHGWPGGGPMSPGRTSRTKDSPVNATALIWKFFERHAPGGQ